MGPVITELFDMGVQTYASDEPVDAAQSDFDTQQYELRFTSNFGGDTEVVTGLWHELSSVLQTTEFNHLDLVIFLM